MGLLVQDQSTAGAVKIQQGSMDAMLVRHMMQAMRLGGKSGEAKTSFSVSTSCQLEPDIHASKEDATAPEHTSPSCICQSLLMMLKTGRRTKIVTLFVDDDTKC